MLTGGNPVWKGQLLPEAVAVGCRKSYPELLASYRGVAWHAQGGGEILAPRGDTDLQNRLQASRAAATGASAAAAATRAAIIRVRINRSDLTSLKAPPCCTISITGWMM